MTLVPVYGHLPRTKVTAFGILASEGELYLLTFGPCYSTRTLFFCDNTVSVIYFTCLDLMCKWRIIPAYCTDRGANGHKNEYLFVCVSGCLPP